MPDFYANFQELKLHEQEGRDYCINASRYRVQFFHRVAL